MCGFTHSRLSMFDICTCTQHMRVPYIVEQTKTDAHIQVCICREYLYNSFDSATTIC